MTYKKLTVTHFLRGVANGSINKKDRFGSNSIAECVWWYENGHKIDSSVVKDATTHLGLTRPTVGELKEAAKAKLAIAA